MQQIQADDAAVELAHGRALGRQLAAYVLAPRPGRAAQIDHEIAGTDQVQLLVDLLDLVGRACAKALDLGEFHIGVVDMVIEPCLIDLLAFGLGFHADYVLPR
ncbi:hypothetical protein D3C85_1649220 [compost metagenome]